MVNEQTSMDKVTSECNREPAMKEYTKEEVSQRRKPGKKDCLRR